MYESGGSWGVELFRPDGLRKLALLPTSGIPVQEPIYACLDCGLLWSSISQKAVADFIIAQGTKEAKKRNA
jgi:hypothetical protein